MAVYEVEVSAEVVYSVNVSGKTKEEAKKRAKEAFQNETQVHVIKWRGVSLREFSGAGED